MSLTFTTTGALAVQDGIKIAVHGRSGAGKTRLCATAPRPMLATAERGTLSIAEQNIPCAIINNLAELLDFQRWVRESQHARNFDTICLDSLSEIAEKLLSVEKAQNKDPRKAYGEMQDQVAVMIRLFRDLPEKNVYFSCKSALLTQPDNTVLYSPMMPGQKLGPTIPYFFDEVFYLGIAKTPEGVPYRYLQTSPDETAEAKDRSGTLDKLEPPDLTHIFNKIRKAVSQPTK